MLESIKHMLQKDKEVCPRCGRRPFMHGYRPDEQYYCTHCHLWEPNWTERNEIIKGLLLSTEDHIPFLFLL